MSIRRHRNKIQALLDAQGNYVYDNTAIKEAATSFYQSLFNGEVNLFFPHIHTRMQINNRGKEYLNSPFSVDELEQPYFPSKMP